VAAPRDRRHILIRTPPGREPYTPHRRNMQPPTVPGPADRRRHAAALKGSLREAQRQALQRRGAAGIAVHGAQPGLYVEFDSQPEVDLKVESLAHKGLGIELVAVTRLEAADGRVTERATVFVPDGAVKHFISRFDQYATERTAKTGEPRHKDMLDRIAVLRLATLRALWTDAPEAYPRVGEAIWWEVWLRRQDGRELERLVEFAGLVDIQLRDRRLEFHDRIVTLVFATPERLAGSLDVLNDLAELRRAKESAGVFADMGPTEQADWLRDLQGRTIPAPQGAPAVCVLDTGVNRAHPLLEPWLADADTHACDPGWGTHDHDGHGTEMAGLALYGDLGPALSGRHPVRLTHVIESVKILPPPTALANRPELYGAVTAEAASRVEVQAPGRRRAFSMAVTATDERDQGQPTSWSAAVDALAAGRSFDPTTQGLVYLDQAGAAQRLFVVCAGNVTSLEATHLNRSDTEPIHDPGQAWNALTVGAHTESALPDGDPEWEGWSPVARPGELSPWSTTSVPFAEAWPVKPDVVFEGGNVVRNDAGQISFPVPALSVLSTHFRPAEKLFVLSWATSASTAQVARIAGAITAEYPDYWPETVRALIVHSAEWTPAMRAHLRGAGTGKKARLRLARRYGFGVPNLERALRSAADALTLVAQATISPFDKGKMREMHVHALPWPKAVLEGLAETPVRLRVTLSYFIEPNPARRGWKRRHRYASHGLRFEVKTATESLNDFRKRLNQRALEEDEERPDTTSDSSDWFLGEQARNRGSIHSDIWVGTAADLAERGFIGVYPVSGWWKDQPARDRSANGARYSLVVSIATDATEVDIWTPVAVEVGVPVEVILP
jgi:hypothetical protein